MGHQQHNTRSAFFTKTKHRTVLRVSCVLRTVLIMFNLLLLLYFPFLLKPAYFSMPDWHDVSFRKRELLCGIQVFLQTIDDLPDINQQPRQSTKNHRCNKRFLRFVIQVTFLHFLMFTWTFITSMLTRKASCRWQTRATLAKSLHGLRKSSGVVSCIARLPIDSLPIWFPITVP